jgi:site-specific DNA recombinase
MDTQVALRPKRAYRLPSMSVRAGIYCRISEDKAGAGLGVERQRKDCVVIAERRGWTVFDTYTDNDISAYSGKPRPSYRRLLEDIRAGHIGAVVVWHLDRLHRQPKELETFIDLVEKHGVALASVAGEHDLASPEGRLHARILGAVARMESEHKSRRIRRQKLEALRQGKPLGGGHRAFGYEADGLRIVPEEAGVIREMASRVLSGDSIRSVCIDLNRRGAMTSANNGWCGRSLARVLTSARTAGLIEHPEIGRIKAEWPGILTERERDELSLFFQRRKTGRAWKCKYLLSGLLKCGECGAPLVAASARNSRGRVYLCYPYANRGCNRVTISANWLEPFVTQAVLDVLAALDLKRPTVRGDVVGATLHEIQRDRQLLDELAQAYAARHVTLNEWLAARAPIELRIQKNEQIAGIEREKNQSVMLLQNPRNMEDVWPTLSVDQQRSVVSSVLDHIVVRRVGRGHYKEPTRLEPVWRA